MRISPLTLRDFRNYSELFFTPSEGLNIIFGENAQGKTNLLESVALLAYGRSHRSPHDAELIRHGAQNAFAAVSVLNDVDDDYPHTIGALLSSNERKAFSLDGERLVRFADLMGCLNIVLFSPESLLLIKGGATERRRFLNMEISQLGGSYFYNLQRYNAILRQKNAVLKSPDVLRHPSYVSTWDEQLISHAIFITKARMAFIERLTPIACEIFNTLSSGTDELDIGYKSALGVNPTEKDAASELMTLLSDSLADDIRRGYTRIGPHRDEMTFAVNGMDARVYASQGQQRALALALKLSEIRLIEKTRNERPIVLLDDVFSELDANRCRALLDYVSRCQCIITCASSASVDMFGNKAVIYTCKNGTLEH